jgi:HAD superfamily hydrolase (TIGR01509 family)
MGDLAALFLDLDGTLVDTAEANFAAYAEALAEVGVTVGRDTFDRASLGRHWRQFLPGLLSGTNADSADVARRKQALYPRMLRHTRLIRPVLSFATSLRSSLKLGLVTTASAPSVSALLAVHALDDLFHTIVTGDDVSATKPSPEPYLLAAQRSDVRPTDCLVIEDSDIGVESARAAGMAVLRLEAVPVIG